MIYKSKTQKSHIKKSDYKITSRIISRNCVQVKLVSRANGDVQVGRGNNFENAIHNAYLSEPIKPKFEPKTILRKSK